MMLGDQWRPLQGMALRHPMVIQLSREDDESLLEQARGQIIAALHAGIVRPGDRLPSLRRVAGVSGLNVKTVMRVYAQLQKKGLVVLRSGSGAYVAERASGGLEPAQALRFVQLVRRHLDEASVMNLIPRAYEELVHRVVARGAFKDRSVAVLECNVEQVRLYSREISARIGVRAQPILLSEVAEESVAGIISSCSILTVTDFHLEEGRRIAGRFRKPLVRLRLREDFLPTLIGAARSGRLAMIVYDTSFFPAFRRALGRLGLQREHVNRIAVVAGADRVAVRRALASADAVYISPLCGRGVMGLVPRGMRLLTFDNHIAEDAVEELEAWLLISNARPGGPARG